MSNAGSMSSIPKQTIIFDFDGVIHSYVSGWQGVDVIPDPPVPGIKDVIKELRGEGYEVVVVSTRCYYDGGIEAIEKYLKRNNIEVDRVTGEKPPAIVTVDDRAICFSGKAEGLVDEIKRFKPWMKKREGLSDTVEKLRKKGLTVE